MKKRLGFLLVALLIVSVLMLTACTAKLVDTQFTAPTKTTYQVGESLNLSGSKITYVYSDDSTVDVTVTSDMLVSTSVPDFTTAGTFTVLGTHEGYDFEFTITVEQPHVPTYSFVAPTKLTYLVGETLDLAGAQVLVDGTPVAVTTEMLDAATIPNFETAGNYTVTGSYQGYAFSFDVTVEAPYVPTYSFVAPTKLSYNVGETLDLTGAQVLVDETPVAVTVDMLDSTSYNMATAGTYTVTGSYNGYAFSFEITVQNLVATSIELATAPTTSVYGHRDSLSTLDVTGGKIKVNYSNGTFALVDMTADMLPTSESNWKLGTVDYTVTYLGLTTTWTVTYENRALTISQFLAGTVGETYDVTGIVVGPASTHTFAELVIKDKNSMQFIGIANTKVVGAYNNLALDTNFVNVGDEIIVSAKLSKVSDTSDKIGHRSRLYANAVNETTFKANYLIASSNNEIVYDFSQAGVVEISTQDQLVSFLNSADRYYKIVKFVGVKAVVYNSSNVPVGQRIFFGDSVTKLSEQKVNGVSPFIYWETSDYYLTKPLQTYFENALSTKYATPGTTKCNVYAMLLGGSDYYHDFVMFGDSWIEAPEVDLLQPTKTTYKVGEALDLAGASISINGGERVAVTADMIDATSYNMAVAGTYTVKGTYQGKEFSFKVTVQEPVYTFTAPTKLTYWVGEAISLEGATLLRDETPIEITPAMLKSAVDMTTAGKKTATIVYDGKEFSFEIEVKAPTYTFTAPSKVKYDVGEELNVDGASVVVVKDTQTTVALTAQMLKQAVDTTTAGAKTVTFVYEGQEFSYQIEVVDAVITFGNPTQTKFEVNEEFAFVGATLTYTYVNKPAVVVNLTVDMLTAVPSTAAAGTYTVTGNYQGYEFSYQISVRTYELSFVAPSKLVYGEGEGLSMAGAQIVKTYSDGEVVTMPATLDMLDQTTIPTMFEVGTYTITGSYQTLNFSFEVTVDIPTASFVAPTKYVYKANEALDLTGAKIVYTHVDGSTTEVAVIFTMLQPINPTLFTTDGFHTVSGSYKYYEFSFEIYVVGTNHTHVWKDQQTTAPTCTEQGYTTYTCLCDHVEKADFVSATGHTEKTLEAVAPTYNTTGLTEGKQCTVCNVITVPQTEVAMLHALAKAGNVRYGTLEDAITAAQAGEVVTLLDNINLNAPLVITKELVLDLAGFEIVYTSTTQGEAMITNRGVLTINDSVGTGVINYNYVGAADSTYGKGNFTISNQATLTVNGGKITIATLRAHAKYPIDNNSGNGDAVLVINGGHLYNYNTSAVRMYCNSTKYLNSVTINGGLLEGYSAIWLQNPGKNTVTAQLTVNGGEVRTTAAAYVNGTATVSEVSSKVYCTTEGGSWSEDSFIKLLGGTFNENVYLAEGAPATFEVSENAVFNGRFEHPHKYVEKVTDPTCTEQGYTTYTCDCGKEYVDNYVPATGHRYSNLQVFTFCEEQGYILLGCGNCDGHWDSRDNGPETTEYLASAVGQFIKLDPKGHTEVTLQAVAPTYNTTGLTEGTKCSVCETILVAQQEVPMLHALAKAGNVRYGTLEDAIAAAQAGEVVTLLDNVTLSAPLVITKELVLDLAGFEIVYTSTTQGEAMITNRGVLTINDSVGTGVINYNYVGAADSTYGKGNFTISNQATLTVNGGKITIATLRAHAKYPIDNNSGNGDAVLVINGGHLYNYNTSAVRMYCNSTKYLNSVTINGGLLEGYSAIWLQNPGKNTVTAQLTVNGGEVRTTAAAYVNGTATVSEVSSKVYCTTEGGSWSEDSFIKLLGGTFNENVYLAEGAPATFEVSENAVFNGRFEHPHKYVEKVTDPTCTEQGYTTYTCDCGKEYVDNYVPATGHRYSNLQVFTFCEEQGYILLGCGNCDGHWDSRDNGPETTEYLNNAVGQFIKLDPKGHKAGEAVVENNVAATCTTDGSYDNVVYCSTCNKELSRETVVVPATGHSYNKLQVTSATCTEDGWFTITCRNCNETFDSRYNEEETQEYLANLPPYINIDVKAKGHTEETIPAKEATCTETGLTAGVKCSVCNEILEAQQEVPAKGHRFSKTVVTPATCTEDGWVTFTCGNCNCEFDSRYDKEAQDYIESLKPFVNFDVAAKGHTEETIPAVEATCTTVGYTAGVKCSVCNEVLEAPQETPAKGHRYSSLKVTTFCEEQGYFVIGCGDCGGEWDSRDNGQEVQDYLANLSPYITIDLSPKGHTPLAAVVENKIPATHLAAGSYEEVVKCKDCDAEISRETKTIDQLAVTGIAIATQPTTTVYGHRDNLSTISVEGGVLEVTCEDGSTALVDMTAEMLPTEETGWKLGTVEYTITYAGQTTTLTITYENRALTVSQIKGTAASEEAYELTGVVISSAFISGTTDAPANGELLIREKGTNNVIGIKNMGVIKENYLASLKVGDEIIVTVTMKVTTTTEGASEYGKIAPYKVADTTVLVVSTDNDALLDVEQATTLADRAALVAWLKNAEIRCGNMYKLVKIPAGTGFVNYKTTKSLFIGYTSSSRDKAKIDGRDPYLNAINYGPTHGDLDILQEFFGTSAINNSWTNKSILKQDVYLMYVGGQGNYYHQFIWLGADYMGDIVHQHTPGEATQENVVPATCKAAGSYDEVIKCSDCGEEMSRTAKTIDKLAHTEETIPAVEATCTTVGYTAGVKCSVCDEVLTAPQETPLAAHTPGAAVEEGRVESTCEEAGYYYSVVKCSVCDAEISRTKMDLDLAAHEYGDWYETLAPTEETEGEERRDCKNCDHYETNKLPVTTHTHAYESIVTAPTCTTDGYTTHTCKCGHTYTDSVVTATGHDYAEKVLSAPTCEEVGVTSYTCNNCEHSYTEEIPATGHAWDEGVVTAPTCTTKGYTTYTCQNDSKHTKVADYVDETAHTPAEAVEEKRVESSCTVAGSYDSVVYCSVCGHEISRKTETLPLAAHTEETIPAVEATCTTVGYTAGVKCSVCDTVLTAPQETGLGNHVAGEWVVTVEPTHLAVGAKTQSCTVCNETLATEEIPVVTVTFVAPTTTNYRLLEEFSVAGSTITFNYTHKEPVTVTVTADMVTAVDTTTAGETTVTVTYTVSEGVVYTTTFTVTVAKTPYTLSQAEKATAEQVAANGVKGYVAAFDTLSGSTQNVSGMYLTDGTTIYVIDYAANVDFANIAYEIGDEVLVNNASLDNTDGGRVLLGTIAEEKLSTANKVDLSTLTPDKVITTQAEMNAWAKKTVPARGLIVKFVGPFVFRGTSTKDLGTGTRLALHYGAPADYGASKYTWKADSDAKKAVIFKYGANVPVVGNSWWKNVGAADTKEATLRYAGGSFTAVSGFIGAESWSWAFVDASTWDIHVRTPLEWAPTEIPSALATTLEAVDGKYSLPTSTARVRGINWALAEEVDGVAVVDNTIVCQDTVTEVKIKLIATFETYTVTLERTLNNTTRTETSTIAQAIATNSSTTLVTVEAILGAFGGYHGTLSSTVNDYYTGIVLTDGTDVLYVKDLVNYRNANKLYEVNGHVLALGDKVRVTGYVTVADDITGISMQAVAVSYVSSGNEITWKEATYTATNEVEMVDMMAKAKVGDVLKIASSEGNKISVQGSGSGSALAQTWSFVFKTSGTGLSAAKYTCLDGNKKTFGVRGQSGVNNLGDKWWMDMGFKSNSNWSASGNSVAQYPMTGEMIVVVTGNTQDYYLQCAPISCTLRLDKPMVKTTVTLDADGGEFTGDESFVVEYAVAVPALPTPTRADSTFVGWYYNGKLIESGDLWKVDAETATLVAKWKVDYKTFATVTDVRTSQDLVAGDLILVEGLFAGVSDEGNGYAREILLKDPANDNLIAVQGLPESYGTWPNVGYKKGDLVRLYVNLVVEIYVASDDESTNDTQNKIYLVYNVGVNPSDINETIVSQDNVVKYNLDNVTTLTSWADWQEFFKVTTIPNYAYVRIKGTVYLNKYEDGKLYRPHANKNASSLATIKPDGARAIGFRFDMVERNITRAVWDAYFSKQSWSTSASNSKKYPLKVDIIAVYTCANRYNYQLTVLEADWLIPVE